MRSPVAPRYSLVLSSMRTPVVIETQIRSIDGADLGQSSTNLCVIDDWLPAVEEPVLAAS